MRKHKLEKNNNEIYNYNDVPRPPAGKTWQNSVVASVFEFENSITL